MATFLKKWDHIKIVLKVLQKYRYRLVFAALFWAVMLFCYQSFRPAAHETIATQNLLRVHAEGLPYINAYMSFGRCDKTFPKDILTETIAQTHLEQNSTSAINFEWLFTDGGLAYGLFSYSSSNQDYPKTITTIGGFAKLTESEECFGFIQ